MNTMGVQSLHAQFHENSHTYFFISRCAGLECLIPVLTMESPWSTPTQSEIGEAEAALNAKQGNIDGYADLPKYTYHLDKSLSSGLRLGSVQLNSVRDHVTFVTYVT